MENGYGGLRLTRGVVFALVTLTKHGSMETLRDPGSKALLGSDLYRRSTRFERGCRILKIYNLVYDERPIQDIKKWTCYRLKNDAIKLLADHDRMMVIYKRRVVI